MMAIQELKKDYGEVPFTVVEELYPELYNIIRVKCFNKEGISDRSVDEVLNVLVDCIQRNGEFGYFDHMQDLILLLDNVNYLIDEGEI